MKICMTILPEDYDPQLDRASSEQDEEPAAKKKRSVYEDGGSANTSCKLRGVRRLIMLCIKYKRDLGQHESFV